MSDFRYRNFELTILDFVLTMLNPKSEIIKILNVTLLPLNNIELIIK